MGGENTTHYERIIGGSQKEKEIVLADLQAAFNERDRDLVQIEIEKTPEDIEIIKKIESTVDRIIAGYGGRPKPVPLDHIYLLKPGGILKMTRGKMAHGMHRPIGGKIGVERGRSRILFAKSVAHEMFHLKSYKAARIGASAEDFHLYRSGLSMFDRKDRNEKHGEEKGYFAMFEEAIVALCAKKALEEVNQDPIFKDEAEAVDKFRNWVAEFYRRIKLPEEKVAEFMDELTYVTNPQENVAKVLAYSSSEKGRQEFAAGMIDALWEKERVHTMERYAERKKFAQTLDQIVKNSHGKFTNKEEVFELFARANFTGNYLPLARVVEGILGKGSFRKLAEESSQEPSNKV